jgi:hypothetical protein
VIQIGLLSGASLRMWSRLSLAWDIADACVYRGAYSVGAHLVTNGGDNEGLFRAGKSTGLTSVGYMADLFSQQSWSLVTPSDHPITVLNGISQCTTEWLREQGMSVSIYSPLV